MHFPESRLSTAVGLSLSPPPPFTLLQKGKEKETVSAFEEAY